MCACESVGRCDEGVWCATAQAHINVCKCDARAAVVVAQEGAWCVRGKGELDLSLQLAAADARKRPQQRDLPSDDPHEHAFDTRTLARFFSEEGS